MPAVVAAIACLSAPAARAGGAPQCGPGDRACIEDLAARLQAGGWVGVVLLRDGKSGLVTIDSVIPDSPAEVLARYLALLFAQRAGPPVAGGPSLRRASLTRRAPRG